MGWKGYFAVTAVSAPQRELAALHAIALPCTPFTGKLTSLDATGRLILSRDRRAPRVEERRVSHERREYR